MSRGTDVFETDDSSQPILDSLSESCSGLRRSAFRAVQRLAKTSPTELRQVVEEQLRYLCGKTGAIDAHLFRVRYQNSEPEFLGIRYHAQIRATDEDLKMLRRFQFHLLDSHVRDVLTDNQIAIVPAESDAGGRLITGLIRQMKCESYLLCPLIFDGRLLGILGIARRTAEDLSGATEFLELLKLNGAILLNHIIQIRRARSQRRRSRRWRRVANQACDFAFSVDERGVIFDTTPFGMGDDTPALNGLRLTDAVRRGFRKQVETQIALAAEERAVRTTVFQLTPGHQGSQWVLARIEPVTTSPRAVATLYLTDNNPDKQLQEENSILTEKLVQASRLGLLGQMSTEFAHQLNQPLQAMLNYCNTMQRRLRKGTDTSENMNASLANIEKSIVYAGEIIQRIRNFVRFRTLQVEVIGVDELIDQSMMMLMPTARAKNADLVTVGAPYDIEIAVDAIQTTHVLINIIVNAIEVCASAGTEQTRIELSVAVDSSHRRGLISVTDNGPGLPKNPARIFSKFFSTKEDGLGMGLAISRDVCEAQGGFLTAENNTDGPGCTFLITVPLATAENVDAEPIPIIMSRRVES